MLAQLALFQTMRNSISPTKTSASIELLSRFFIRTLAKLKMKKMVSNQATKLKSGTCYQEDNNLELRLSTCTSKIVSTVKYRWPQ